ncbi:GSU2403 family nucleotidyltransferase fold protein [Paracoccus litorisediminis]|uniref:nucleotidyltransferase family protein n=1 Tax=Paracoccus litorisediminis TaxID=2006130 RepID=UPI0037336D09
MDRLPVSLQTLYADMVDRAWSSSFEELIQAGGSPYLQKVGDQQFWYLKMPMLAGIRKKSMYLGPDGPDIQRRLAAHHDLRAVREERISMIRSLRAARLPGPDPLSGKIMSALAEAGAFRLRAVVVGSAAFQIYSPMLGVRFENVIGQTGDLDIAQFHAISIATDDEIAKDFLTTLQEADPRFKAIPSPMDGRRTLRYAIRVGQQEEFSVDLLCPLRGPDRGPVTELKSLKADAQLLRYLDFLIRGEVNAVALYGLGIPINVPAPERYAVHKLIVSRMRIQTAQSQAKARKDIRQAEALIGVLSEDRPYELASAWAEARDRGPSWRAKLDEGIGLLRPDIRDRLLALPK